jgi:hypothetical protein
MEPVWRQPQTVGANRLGLACTSIVFSWRETGGHSDAAEIFASVFECDASRIHRNKFPTTSMPCHSWAHGLSNGVTADVRIGVDGDRSEIRGQAEGEGYLLPDALQHLKSRLHRLSNTQLCLAGPRLTVDFELPASAQYTDLLRWLGLPDWQAQAGTLKLDVLLGGRDDHVEASVATIIDRKNRLARLAVSLGATTDKKTLPSTILFDRLDHLLSADNLAEAIV